ncbi:MAG: hypothetical protein IPH35_11280 [Rhodoferax sp.]|nr:hypothetical protein [Rhodoferax sp.]
MAAELKAFWRVFWRVALVWSAGVAIFSGVIHGAMAKQGQMQIAARCCTKLQYCWHPMHTGTVPYLLSHNLRNSARIHMRVRDWVRVNQRIHW